MRVIYVARRLLFHTPLGKSKVVGRIYRAVFALSAPDLTEPIPFRGTTLYVDPKDRTYVPSMVGGYYEAKLLDIFEQLVTHASVLFDLGANIGIYSVIGGLRTKTLQVYAFEPMTENQAILRRNIDAHDLSDRVHVEPVAVSREAGKARIYLGYSGTHSIDSPQGNESREIDTVSLDEFTARRGVRPDLMKIDVEGHESAVIDGASALLSKQPPTTIMEYTPGAHRDLEGLIDRLTAAFHTCFMVDEISGEVREMNPNDLDRRKGYNLILTSDPRHAEEIRAFVG